MAKGFYFSDPSDRNRDGVDDDIDRRPGNSAYTASYARRFDPRSEREFTNQLEPQDQLQQSILEQQDREYADRVNHAMSAARHDVHFFPDVGKFIIPAENTWAAHAALVLDNDTRLHFNPDKYFFDKIIADKLKIPGLANPEHPDFAKYRGLRTNLEVLRNDIIGMYLDDGGFDKGDEVYIPILKNIATVLADGLSNDSWWKRPFVRHLNFDVANVEAVGASEMYKFLLREEDQPTMFGKMWSSFLGGLRELLGLPDRNWGLLPLDHTPFSPEALSAPPPQLEKMVGTPAAPAQNLTLGRDDAEHHAVNALALIKTTNAQKQAPESLDAPDKNMAIEDGRTILRWLGNLRGTELDVQDFLSMGAPAEQLAKAEALGNLVQIVVSQMQQHRDFHHLPEVKDGGDAAGGVAMMIAEHAMSLLPEHSPAYALLASAVDSMPEVHFERSHQSVSQLLTHMENGLTRLTGTQLNERAALDRLLEASANIDRQAKQLHSLDTLAEPKREESVELGREILRKLRGMIFSDKPMAELIDSGKPEEKLRLVEKIGEMVEIYRNLLATALIANPGLAVDPRIKAANDAIGGMTHGIKLMAAKEIPNSMAQTQQIGADVTQDPAQWGQLHERAVGRLLESMQGGLEAAVSSMEQQEQQQQKEADLAQEAVDTAMKQADNSRRKRRRRRSQPRSGITKSEKIKQDLAADDRAAGQGRFGGDRDEKAGKSSVSAPKISAPKISAPKTSGSKTPGSSKQSAYPGLGEKDIAAIKSLGATLRGAGKSAKDLPIASASLSVPVSPDDKTAAERAIEQITNARKNPNQRTT